MIELELKPLLPLTLIRDQPFQFPPFADKPYPQEILEPLTQYLLYCPRVVEWPAKRKRKAQGKVGTGNPRAIHSDGVYYWREDAATYLRRHPIRIDDEALEYFISRDWQWPDFSILDLKAHKIAWALTNAYAKGDFPEDGVVTVRYQVDDLPVQTPFTLNPLTPFVDTQPGGFRAPVLSPMVYSREVLDRLVPYLRNAPLALAWMGVSHDLIGDKFISIGGIAVVSDGKFYWRCDAADYLEHYPIRIPDEALSYFLSRNWEPPDFDTRSPRGLAIEKALTSSSALDLDTGIVTVPPDEGNVGS